METGLSRHQYFDEIKTLLRDNSVKFSAVTKWFCEFNCWRDILEDEPRSGRLIEVTNDKNVQRFPQLIEADQRVTYKDIKDFFENFIRVSA